MVRPEGTWKKTWIIIEKVQKETADQMNLFNTDFKTTEERSAVHTWIVSPQTAFGVASGRKLCVILVQWHCLQIIGLEDTRQDLWANNINM